MALSLTPVVSRPGSIYAIQSDATCTVDTLKGSSGKSSK